MVRYNVTEIKLQASVSTQSNEINLNDNTHVITIYFDVDVGLTIVRLVYLDVNIIYQTLQFYIDHCFHQKTTGESVFVRE